MKNIFLLTLIVYIIGCGTKSDPAIVYGVAPLLASGNSDTSYSANGDTIITVYKKVINVKCDTVITNDSVKTLRRYVPPVTTPPVTGTRKNLTREEGFESANFLSSGNVNKWGFEKCCDYSITQSKDFARTGTGSMKIDLRKVNNVGKADIDVGGSKRAEIKQPTEQNNIERWYGVSYYFPAGYKADPSCPEIIFQWHHNSGTGSPPLALWSYGNYLSFNQYNISAKKDGLTKVADITPGKWMDVVFHIKFSAGSEGLTEVWINGVKKYSKSGVNNYSGSAGNDYLKTGLYKWGWKNGYRSTVTERTIYIDDIRIGNEKATYNDVAP